MGKKVKLRDVFQPGDILAFLVVVTGVLIAIFLEGVAIKLIGASVAVLGILAIVMLVSQRLSDVVESNKFNLPETQKLRMTVVKDSAAKRQTVENFDASFSADLLNDENVTMGAEEGFRVVSKSTRSPKPEEANAAKTVSKPAETATQGITSTEDGSAPKAEQTADSKESDSETTIAPVPDTAQTKVTEEKIMEEYTATEKIVAEQPAIEDEQPAEPTLQQEITHPQAEPANKYEAAAIPTDELVIEVPEATPQEQTEEAIGSQPLEFIEETAQAGVEKIDEPEAEEAPIQEIEAEVAQQQEPAPAEAKEEPAKPEPKKAFKKKQIEVPMSLLADDEFSIGTEPRKEFDAFVTRLLWVIRSVINTRTTSLILVNPAKQQLILEAYVTNLSDAIVSDAKIPMSNDIVSQIIASSKPEILTEINPSAELDLIPYYSSRAGTASFVGVPIFYENQVIGIIGCDTNEKDAYDAATVSFLGHFSKLISLLFKSYTDKDDLLQADKSLQAINKFTEMASQAGADYLNLGQALVNTVVEMYDAQTVGVCLFDDRRNGWYVTSCESINGFSNYLQTEPVDLFQTLIGDAIVHAQAIFENPITSQKPRVSPKEIALPSGYFIAVPIRSESNTYGALFIEGASHSGIVNFDLEILSTIATSAGHGIERINLIKMLQTSSIIDPDTGLMNNTAFFRRLQEEIARIRDYKTSASLCLISIDKYAAFEQETDDSRFERINRHVVHLINKNLHEYDVLGDVETGVFAVILVGQGTDKARIWGDKIRNSAAISVIEIDNRRFTVTLSIGIAQISPADSLESLLGNCGKVLNIAIAKTNCVQVYH